METKIYKAGKPLINKWALQWRSPSMPGPAFDYYDSKAEAEAARARMIAYSIATEAPESAQD